MAPRWGTAALLLMTLHVTSGFMKFCPKPPPSSRYVAKSLMMKCLEMGHRVPVATPQTPDSAAEVEGRADHEDNMLYDFQSILSTLPGGDTLPWGDTLPGGDTSRAMAGAHADQWMKKFKKLKMKMKKKCKRSGKCKYKNKYKDNNVTEEKDDMWNCTDLPSIIRMMKNSTGPWKCFREAFVAPLSWAAVTGEAGAECGEDGDCDEGQDDDYDSMLWAAKPLLQSTPPPRMHLPRFLKHRRVMKMMETLNGVFGSLSERQRSQVRDWAKRRFACGNATGAAPPPKGPGPRPQRPPKRPPTGPGSPPESNPPKDPSRPGPTGPPRPPPEGTDVPVTGSDACPSKLMFLKTMGRFLSRLDVDDVRSIPKEQLCEFFASPQFRASFTEVEGMRPLLARRILRRVQECSTDKKEFLQRLDRLGSLACYYEDAPRMNADLSSQLLSQLDACRNSGARKLKKRLVNAVMSSKGGEGSADLLRWLGPGVTALSPRQLAQFPPAALSKALGKLGPKFKWRANQARRLAKKLLQGSKVSGKELLALGSAVRGVEISTLKRLVSEEELDSQLLSSISNKLSKGQRKALLETMRGKAVNASELVSRAPAALLSSVSLGTLDRARLTSLEQLEGRVWSRAQSAFLTKRLLKGTIKPKHIRKLGSAIQGMVCKMIDSVAEGDAMEMAQIMTETPPRWLSRAQVSCAARKLFSSLEKQRDGYFQSITEDQMEDIPTMFLIRLPPWKIRDLPDSVCESFLEKMSEANLTSLPLRAPSRRALTNRALRCLTNGSSISDLSGEDMLRLGPLLCEVSPTELSQLGPDVLNASLRTMASCAQIPPRHRGELLQLLNQSYGDPSDWSAETMESLGPLLLLDDAAVRRLRYRSWLKRVLWDMKDEWSQSSGPGAFQTGRNVSALREKLFFLAVRPSADSAPDEDPTAPPARGRRSAADYPDEGSVLDEGLSDDLSDWWPKAPRKRRNAPGQQRAVPTAELIEELGEANALWSAAQLRGMTPQAFEQAAETLGSVGAYSAEQLAVLRDKTLEAWGEVSALNESQVMELGCISRAFSVSELEDMAVNSTDTLEALALCPWTQEQVRAVWRGFSRRAAVKVSELGAVEISQLDQFICGLSPEDILELHTDAFKEAVDSIAEVSCGVEEMQALKQQAVAAFGPPVNWSEAQVSILGNIMASLDPAEMSSVDADVFSYLSQSSVPLIPAQTFHALSVSQLRALGPDNAAMVTDAQRAGLSQDKLSALDSALDPDLSRSDPPGGPPDPPKPAEQSVWSGAPSVIMEGTVAWGKAVLCLVLGLLLL